MFTTELFMVCMLNALYLHHIFLLAFLLHL